MFCSFEISDILPLLDFGDWVSIYHITMSYGSKMTWQTDCTFAHIWYSSHPCFWGELNCWCTNNVFRRFDKKQSCHRSQSMFSLGTLLKFKMEPKNDGFQVRNLLFHDAIFRWTMLNFGRLALWHLAESQSLTLSPSDRIPEGWLVSPSTLPKSSRLFLQRSLITWGLRNKLGCPVGKN